MSLLNVIISQPSTGTKQFGDGGRSGYVTVFTSYIELCLYERKQMFDGPQCLTVSHGPLTGFKTVTFSKLLICSVRLFQLYV